jgi:hypothetical protein
MRTAVWVLLILTGLWAVDAWLGLGVFWEHDLRHHHIPWRVWAAEEWAGGRIPLWNPDVGNGFPLTADGQTGTFYLPTMLLFGLFPAGIAVNLSILGHVAWAAEGMRRLMGRLEVHGPGALLAAIAFAFSGFMTTHAGYLGMQNAVAWLPWLAAAAVVGRWAPVGLCAAMMMVAGHPQIAVIGLLGGLSIAVWKRNIHLFLVGVLVAVIAASPQILATAELLEHSMRAGGVSAEFARTGALPFQELLSTVLPHFFGIERPGDILQSYVHRGDGYWGGGVSHWDTVVYLGIPVSVLAVLGARGRRFWVGMSVVAILLMTASPLWEVLRLLPVLDTMRYPARFSVLLTLAVAVLAGHGLQQLSQHPAPGRIVSWLAAAAGGLVLSMAIAARTLAHNRSSLLELLTSRYASRLDWTPEEADLRAQQIVDGLAQSLNPATSANLLVVGLLVALATLVWLSARRILPVAGLAVGILALSYADFWVFGHDYNVRTPRIKMEQPPSALARIGPALQRGRIAVVDRRRHPDLDKELINANMGLQYGLSDVLVPSPLRNLRNDALVAKLGLDIGDRGPVKWERVLDNVNLLNLMGVRWLFSEHPQPLHVFSQHMATPVHVYENTMAMPREFLVACVEQTDDPWAQLDGLQPHVWAIVEEDVGLPECRTPLGAGSIVSEVDESDHRVMTVNSPLEALLVSVETHAPGWMVTVNGEPQTIHRTNWNFRGIRVPAGSSTVELIYHPVWLSAAVPMASLAWLGLLFGIIRRDD